MRALKCQGYQGQSPWLVRQTSASTPPSKRHRRRTNQEFRRISLRGVRLPRRLFMPKRVFGTTSPGQSRGAALGPAIYATSGLATAVLLNRQGGITLSQTRRRRPGRWPTPDAISRSSPGRCSRLCGKSRRLIDSVGRPRRPHHNRGRETRSGRDRGQKGSASTTILPQAAVRTSVSSRAPAATARDSAAPRSSATMSK